MEVVVALLVFQVGMLAVGTGAYRTLEHLGRVRAVEWGLGAVRALGDSLAAGATPRSGEREERGVRLSWTENGAWVTARVESREGRLLFSVRLVGTGP